MTGPNESTAQALRVRVNGAAHAVAGPCTLTELLQRLAIDTSFVAVAVNRACVRRRDLDSTPVRDADEIEIVSPQAGG
jgi:thiamine biosynthesis protein ThiS